MHEAIRVGVAGWDYPDWRGTVYPAGTERGFDPLVHLSRFVDAVEINSTFYRPVTAPQAAAWVRRTSGRPTFRFSAKAHRSFTHEPESDPGEEMPRFLEGLGPLREAGILGAILLQFPQSFHRTRASSDRLERLVSLLDGWPLAVEFRHVSWDDDAAAEWCRRRGVGWCVADQPRVGASTIPSRPRTTSSLAYLRLHGRNARNWFREGAGRDARYDYLYSMEELEPLARCARDLAAGAEIVFVIQNNHFRGQALANALMMKHLLQESAPEAPESIVRAFPQLTPYVTTRREGLF